MSYRRVTAVFFSSRGLRSRNSAGTPLLRGEDHLEVIFVRRKVMVQDQACSAPG